MLIQFSVENYLSFKKRQVFNLQANGDKELRDSNIFSEGNFDLIKNAVIFGSNASGKSNFIKALLFIREFILNSYDQANKGKDIAVTPFLLDDVSASQPSVFELIFIADKDLYRYGFAVSQKAVAEEWLFITKKSEKPQESRIFTRDKNGFTIGAELKQEKFDSKRVKEKVLALSKLMADNYHYGNIIAAFIHKLKCISADEDEDFASFSASGVLQKNTKKKILKFLNNADFQINDLYAQDVEKDHFAVFAKHNKFNDAGNVVGECDFNMLSEESAGTKQFFHLTRPILNALDNQDILLIDEIDVKLHPELVKFIIEKFNSQKFNAKGAQFICVSHNNNILSDKLLRRDQIWFTERNEYGASDLYSLADFKDEDGIKIRKDLNFQKAYREGKFGATPFIIKD